MVTLNGKNGEHITLSVSQLEDALARVKEQTADKSEICFTELSGNMEVTSLKEPVQDKKGLLRDKEKSTSGKAAVQKMRVRAVRQPARQTKNQGKTAARTHLKVSMAGKSWKPPIAIYVKDTASPPVGRHFEKKEKTHSTEKQKGAPERAAKRRPVEYMSMKSRIQRGTDTRSITPIQPGKVPQPDVQNARRKIRGTHIGSGMFRNSQTIRRQREQGREAPLRKHSYVKEKSPGKKPVRRNLDELEVMGKRMVQARKIMITAATITLSSGRMTSFTDKNGRKLTFRREMEDNLQTGQKESMQRDSF